MLEGLLNEEGEVCLMKKKHALYVISGLGHLNAGKLFILFDI